MPDPVLPADDAGPQPVVETTALQPVVAAELPVTAEPAEPVDPATADASRSVSARESAIERIVRHRHEVLASELAAADRVMGEPAPAVPEPTSEPARDTPAMPAAAPPVAADPASEPLRVHKIRVGGREIDMPEPDLIRAAELGVVSEARLRQAQQLHDEAMRLRTTPPTNPSAEPSPAAAPSQTLPVIPPGLSRDEAEVLAEEFLYGDKAKVADAILRLSARPAQASGIDPGAIAGEVHSRIGAQLRLESALNTFAQEYSEIVADSDLTTLAADYVQKLRNHYAQTGTPRTELDLFREGGEMVRRAMSRWGGSQPNPQPNNTPTPAAPIARLPADRRVAVKRATPQAPAAAAAQSEAAPSAAPTGSQIVAQMRRARGQPVYG
jgi:hypothetical protein